MMILAAAKSELKKYPRVGRARCLTPRGRRNSRGTLSQRFEGAALGKVKGSEHVS